MQSKAEQIQLLLVTAVQNALPDIVESYKAVHYEHPNVAISAVTTLTKIKMLEVLAAKATAEVMAIKPYDMGRMMTEIGVNAVVQLVATGVLSGEMAKQLYKHYQADDLINKAAAGHQPCTEEFKKAVETLDESLEKIEESKK
jgi:hypothetical protein